MRTSSWATTQNPAHLRLYGRIMHTTNGFCSNFPSDLCELFEIYAGHHIKLTIIKNGLICLTHRLLTFKADKGFINYRTYVLLVSGQPLTGNK